MLHDVAKVLNTKAWSESENHLQITSFRSIFNKFIGVSSLEEFNLQLLEDEYEQIIDYTYKHHSNFRKTYQKICGEFCMKLLVKRKDLKMCLNW